MAKAKTVQSTGIVLVITYLVLFIISSLVIFLANLFFPYYVVLGNLNSNIVWSLIHSMGVLALITTFAIPFVRIRERVLGRMLTSQEWMIYYFILNFVSVWLIARFADQFGFGIRSWVIALVLALILDLAQGISLMQLEKLRH
jgi:hypothetical protein